MLIASVSVVGVKLRLEGSLYYVFMIDGRRHGNDVVRNSARKQLSNSRIVDIPKGIFLSLDFKSAARFLGICTGLFMLCYRWTF